jgi:hypothetical protein
MVSLNVIVKFAATGTFVAVFEGTELTTVGAVQSIANTAVSTPF